MSSTPAGAGGKPGRMRIRIVSASNLPPVMNLFRWGTADPYAVIVLEDRTNNKQSPQHRTRRLNRTLNPRWREDFWFALVKGTANLNLHIEIWHYNEDKEHTFLGQADIDLSPYLLDLSPSKSNSFEREQVLQPPEDQELAQLLGQVKMPGTVKIEMAWEPALMDHTAIAGPRNLLSRLLNAPQALRVMRVVLFGGAGALLIVSRNARWLCRGPSLGQCHQMSVPGAATCVSLSAMAVIVVTFIHFAGSSGLLGSAWTGEPVGLMDLLDHDLHDEGHPDDMQEESTLRMQVLNEGLTKWNVNVGTAFLPKISFNVLRITAMLAYLLSFVLCTLAVLLAWVEHGPGTCLGEAVYIDLYALFCLFCGFGTSIREKQLLLVADRDRWRTVDESGRGDDIHRLTSMNSPGLRLELVEEWARKGVDRLTQQAETLTQPLKDAWQPLQERMMGGQVERLRRSMDGFWGASSQTPERLSQPLLRSQISGAISPSRRPSHEQTTRPRIDLQALESDQEATAVAAASSGNGCCSGGNAATASSGGGCCGSGGGGSAGNGGSTRSKQRAVLQASVSGTGTGMEASGDRLGLGTTLRLADVEEEDSRPPDLSSKSVCCRC